MSEIDEPLSEPMNNPSDDDEQGMWGWEEKTRKVPEDDIWDDGDQDYYQESEKSNSSILIEEEEEVKRLQTQKLSDMTVAQFLDEPFGYQQLESSVKDSSPGHFAERDDATQDFNEEMDQEELMTKETQKSIVKGLNIDIRRQIQKYGRLLQSENDVRDQNKHIRQRLQDTLTNYLISAINLMIAYKEENTESLNSLCDMIVQSKELYTQQIDLLNSMANVVVQSQTQDRQVDDYLEQVETRLNDKKQRRVTLMASKLAKSGRLTQLLYSKNLAEGSEPRQINNQILKNRGLTRRRKKIDRNPRMKLKKKYHKAQVMRKSQGVGINHKIDHKEYYGEISGIKRNLIKGVKLG